MFLGEEKYIKLIGMHSLVRDGQSTWTTYRWVPQVKCHVQPALSS